VKILSDWLTERAEDAPTTYHPEFAADALRIRMAWQRLKAGALSGDELWAWATPESMWKKHGRASGYALVHEGEIRTSVRVTPP
jgi:hypothetical protein